MRQATDCVQRRLGLAPEDEGDWTSNVPVDQIPAVIQQLAALQCRLAATWLAEHDGRPSNNNSPGGE